MPSFDTRPWAKRLAGTVIVVTVIALTIGAFYLHSIKSLGIPEIVGIIMLLLAILPPNIHIFNRKPPVEPAGKDSPPPPKINRPILH
jgi:uncharacterized membrane protein